MRLLILLSVVVAAGCVPRTPALPEPVAAPTPAPVERPTPATDNIDARTAVRNFVAVVADVEPVAERVCREVAPQQNCDFRILVDDRRGAPANAFQTLDKRGQPIIAFTVPLIIEARNRDEVAFILAHEAAHHIEGHIARGQRNARIGAELATRLAGAVGAEELQQAAQIGAVIGARTFSKEFELEADARGTLITLLAGYDPLIGARFFTRIPDPGNQFLGTHPANADRIATVERVTARVRGF